MSKTAINTVRTFAPQMSTIDLTVEKVRQLSSIDSEIRVRVDNTAHSVVAFTATWVNRSSMVNHRRVFLETKIENGVHRVIFSEKLFDENSVTNEYTAADLAVIAGDVLRFLRNGTIVQRKIALAA